MDEQAKIEKLATAFFKAEYGREWSAFERSEYDKWKGMCIAITALIKLNKLKI